MLLHRVSVLPDESLIVALLSSLIVALHHGLKLRKPVAAIAARRARRQVDVYAGEYND